MVGYTVTRHRRIARPRDLRRPTPSPCRRMKDLRGQCASAMTAPNSQSWRLPRSQYHDCRGCVIFAAEVMGDFMIFHTDRHEAAARGLTGSAGRYCQSTWDGRRVRLGHCLTDIIDVGERTPVRDARDGISTHGNLAPLDRPRRDRREYVAIHRQVKCCRVSRTGDAHGWLATSRSTAATAAAMP